MLTIPNQSSGANAYQEFDDAGRMKPSSYFDRAVDVMEELVKFTLLTRDLVTYLTDRYSERVESAAALNERVSLKSATGAELSLLIEGNGLHGPAEQAFASLQWHGLLWRLTNDAPRCHHDDI